MKHEKLIFCIALVASTSVLFAQQSICPPATASTVISGNEIHARIRANGSLFSEGEFHFNPNPNINNPHTIYNAAIWLGGIGPNAHLKLSGPGPAAGPLDDNGTTDTTVCANWDRLFRAFGSDVAAFLSDLPDLMGNPAVAITQYKDIMGWPGRGNPYFAEVWGFDLPLSTAGLAPFFDKNQDELYDPLQGEYPVVQLQDKPPFVPETIVWTVSNDTYNYSSSMRSETQLTAWEFNCPDQPVLNRTLFTAHKYIYRGVEIIDSCFAGIWVDFDLGCHADDYVGCDTTLDVFYAYNQGAVDGTTGVVCDEGIVTFADSTPVQSVTMLNRTMDKFMYSNNPSVGNQIAATTDPGHPTEFYRYLNGYWNDGSPLTDQGSGYNSPGAPTNYAFPSDPADPNGWSMCTAGLPSGDRRALGVHKIGQLAPGAVTEFVTAWTVHPDPDLPCGIGSTLSEVEEVRGLYNNGFAGVCSPLTGVSDVANAQIHIFPNPAALSVTLKYGGLSVREIRLIAADGKVLRSFKNLPPEQTVIETTGLNNGIYFLKLQTEQSSTTKLVVILR